MATNSQSQARPRRAARIRYPNDDSDSDDFFEFERMQRPSRAARRVQNYREASDDESPSFSTDSGIESTMQATPPQRSLRSHGSSPVGNTVPTSSRKRKLGRITRSQSSRIFKAYPRTKMQGSNPASAHDSKTREEPDPKLPLGTAKNVPPWQQLPYHVLFKIMQFASSPLYSAASRSNPSINWLCTSSTLCRSFHEACLAALLYSPPLYPPSRARRLLQLLEQNQDTLTTDYRRKIHHLDIEVKHLLFRKSGISLIDLVEYTPVLDSLRLYSNHDDLATLVWAQPKAQRFNWSYPPELFDVIDKCGLSVRSFEWNGRFSKPTEALGCALHVHSRPSFRRLREASFLNLTLPEKSSDSDTTKAQNLLAGALMDLPDLQRLLFRNCGVIDEAALLTLPTALTHLELIHCSSLTSDALEQYLVSGGFSLRSLILNGNQSMSLGFMATLKSLCPRLQTIEIDMLYVDPTSYHDRDPLYDELLPKGSPTWPSDLVSVSLENLRQLSASDAEDFLASLVDSSKDLPHLKRLNIKAILSGASWRDRAQLRATWLPKLEHVFLSNAQPENMANGHRHNDSSLSQQRVAPIAKVHLRQRNVGSNTDGNQASNPNFLHGRCDVVNLVISQQRPAQEQYHERDFLDDEPSDDGEWEG